MSLPPPRTTELYYGGAWHTAQARESSPVTIERGVSAEGTIAGPSAASQVLDNTSGDLSPRNPLSPLHGEIGRNTPWRFTVRAGSPRVVMPGIADNAITTPDHATLTITGDLDLRLDAALDSWREEMSLAGRYESTGSQRSWVLRTNADGQLYFRWSPDGLLASAITVTSTAPVPAHNGQRLCVRVTLDVDNGAGGSTVTFYTGQHLTGRWQSLGTPVTTAGTTSVFDGTEGIQIGSVPDFNALCMRGSLYGMQLYNGIGGTLAVDLDVAAAGADPGDPSFTDATGLVWTTRDGAALTNEHVRMAGEVPAWPPSRDLSGADRTVPINPAGIMRRLGAGKRPLDSALRRYLIGNEPLECWPLTDGTQATHGASLRGSAPALADGNGAQPLWGEGEVADWIEPVMACPLQTYGTLRAVPSALGTASWSVDLFRAGRGQNEWIEINDRGAGTAADPQTRWSVYCQTVPNQILLFRQTWADDTSSVAFLGDLLAPGIYDERPHHLRFTTRVSGSNTFWELYVDGELKTLSVEAFAGKPIGHVDLLWDLEGSQASDVSMGYLTCWNSSGPSAADVYDAFHGFPGEPAGARVLRLSGEHGVPVSVAGQEAAQTLLGTQIPGRYLETLATIAASDLGVLFERRDDRELVYRARSTLYSQDPVLTLDWPAGVISEPFRPTDDDKNTENDVAVTREGGATSPRAVLTTGRMSVQDPPAGVGRYDEDYTLSLAADHQTGEHAEWRMHLGTFDGLRFTRITLDLGNSRVYAMVDDIYRADVGDVMRLTNLPDDYGPDDVDLIIRGYTEEISDTTWTITFNCSPAAPWQVGVVEDPLLGRADTDGTVLAAAVDASATSWPVAVTAGPHWITTATHPSEFPFAVTAGGEQVTVTALTGLVEDRFGRTVASGWGTADTGQAWLNEGGAASDHSVASGRGVHVITAAASSRRSSVDVGLVDVDVQVDIQTSALATGAALTGALMARYTNGDNLYLARLLFNTDQTVDVEIRKRVAGTETGLASFRTGLTHAAGTNLRLRFQVASGSLRARAWAPTAPEPPSWQAEATDSALAGAASIGCRSISIGGNTNVNPQVRYDGFVVLNPQVMTVTRSVNGITKGHTVGTSLSLTHPMRAAL
ncbi:hypothetical protein CG717_16160 [Streptomyces sp. CB02613]|uniref:hypothetical protein n=1 Tax=Streptomyces sp. CB02613 TaxID=2020328 RepID=UPI000C27857E|nr:hypothetical protein [Streptomyces sp. CB02613]PJN31301.1 hypothetical protein CG717_16160 [Streptomyces sp. CB02613]